MLCILFKLLNNLNEAGSFASVTDKEIEAILKVTRFTS